MSDEERPIEEWDYRWEIIPIERLFVDREYQRRLSNLAKEIAVRPIMPLFMTLCVSARHERTHNGVTTVVKGAVFDGQTRLEGAKGHNGMVSRGEKAPHPPKIVGLPLCVYTGLSQAQEAQLFEWIQTRRRNAASYDSFRASIVAKNPESLAIQALVEATGYEIGYAGMSDRTIASVRAVQGMFRADPAIMERTLIIYYAAWKTKWIPSGYQLRGMAALLVIQPDIDDERLVRRLSIQSPADLEDKAMQARRLKGTKRSITDMVDAIKAVYAMREDQVTRRENRA